MECSVQYDSNHMLMIHNVFQFNINEIINQFLGLISGHDLFNPAFDGVLDALCLPENRERVPKVNTSLIYIQFGWSYVGKDFVLLLLNSQQKNW